VKKRMIQLICLILVSAVAFAAAPVNLPAGAAAFETEPMLAAGESHVAALKSDGTVWSWGRNNFGQLGDGTEKTVTQKTTPVQAKNMDNVQAIATGSSHTVALKNDGTVWAWGWNIYGQLGDALSEYRDLPAKVAGLSDVKAVAAGLSYTVALKNDGTVWTWGNNNHGQLGIGTYTKSSIPMKVTGVSGIKAIEANYSFVLALGNDGTVWAWGENDYGQLGDGTQITRTTPVQVIGKVQAIANGNKHTIVLKNDGTVWGWGRNNYGQLGNGEKKDSSLTHVQTTGLNNVRAIEASLSYTMALKNDGTVWMWGNNELGKLGIGTSGTYETAPVQVTALGNTVRAIAAGSLHAAAIKNDGTVWAWGNNVYGQLGEGSINSPRTLPMQVMGLDRIGYFNVYGVAPSSVELTPGAKSLAAGKTFTITPTVFPSNATHKTLTWTSSKPGVASVSSGGRVTAKAAGKTTITAKTINGMTADCTVTVTEILPASVKLSPAAKDLIVGKSFTITPTVSPSNASNKTVIWSSSNTKVASVSSAGKVTAKVPGAATITAKTSNGKTAACKVTVHTYVSLRIGYTKAIQNGVKGTIDSAGTKPLIISGKTMLPIRFVGEKMGATVTYVNEKTPIKLVLGKTTVTFTLGQKVMYVNRDGKKTTVTLDVPAQVKGGKTYIPLRAVGQALGFDVYYDSKTEIIVINNPKMTPEIQTERLNEAKAYIK